MLPINQVLQGDCTRVLRTLPNEVVDLVVTDPPYGVRYQDGTWPDDREQCSKLLSANSSSNPRSSHTTVRAFSNPDG